MNRYTARTNATLYANQLLTKGFITKDFHPRCVAAYFAGYMRVLRECSASIRGDTRTAQRFEIACQVLDLRPERVIDRNGRGQLRRGPWSDERRAVWLVMRTAVFEWYPSYPEIARATGTGSHSSVLGGVESLREVMRANPAKQAEMALKVARYVELVRETEQKR